MTRAPLARKYSQNWTNHKISCKMVLFFLKMIFSKKEVRNFLLENVLKNIAILVILALLWHPIEAEILSIRSEETVKTVLIFVGLIVIAPLFGVYGFSYQHTNFKLLSERFFSHLTTASAMLISVIFLKMIDALFVRLVSPDAMVFRMTLAFFYFSIVLYDFWDLLRFWKNNR